MSSEPGHRWRSIFSPVYSASMDALNPMTLAIEIDLESTGIKVNAVSLGFTRTNLNIDEGIETLQQGAAEAVRVALLGPDSPTGASRTDKTKQSRGDSLSVLCIPEFPIRIEMQRTLIA